ncbi:MULTISPECIES: hypothetical protein [unclassified Microbacterium]|uniref:hypothetical protein n=1 Tax=unclassified Microbacterium TaxID=2609290 RepID=UPI003019078A
MGTVTVHAATPISRKVAGVAFIDGVASVDEGSAAHAFFVRNDAFRLGAGVPPEGTPLTPEELARVAERGPEGAEQPAPATPASQSQQSPEGDPGTTPPAPPAGDSETVPAAPGEGRPHPVRDGKGVWFTYLDGLKPDHGFDLESVSRKELIDAVEQIEAARAS